LSNSRRRADDRVFMRSWILLRSIVPTRFEWSGMCASATGSATLLPTARRPIANLRQPKAIESRPACPASGLSPGRLLRT
jgi:hypothetical protein